MPSLTCFLLLSGIFLKVAASPSQVNVTQSCEQIAAAISNASAVFWPGNAQYESDIAHYFDSSSTTSVCSVEPGTAADVGKVLRILGMTSTPFGVKGGGHAYNANFSSSPGVEISMTRFNSVVYHAENQTADVGAGLVWDDVYAALEPFNVTVVGGRISGIGVSGFALGGGYSFLTNEVGLAMDNIAALEIALPSGEVLTINEESNSDLFSAVKGGYNNFGIVTTFTLKTVAQGPVWGGILIISGNFTEQVNAATARFSAEVDDPKAAILSVDNFSSGQLLFTVNLFYNGPNPPSGMFDDFLAIPVLLADVSTRSYLSLIQSTPSARLASRGLSSTVPLTELTPAIIDAVLNETTFWGNELLQFNVSLSFAMEPFRSDILSHASVDSAAYPISRDIAYLPFAITFEYDTADADAAVLNAAAQAATHISQVALSLCQEIEGATPYGNYALAATTTAEDLYGDKLPGLRFVKAMYDPANVMGLTGGWKI